MSGKEMLQYALEKNGAWEDAPFGPDVIVVKVGNNMFALFSRRDARDTVSLKCNPDYADILRQQYQSILPGYHLNKRHWNTLILDEALPVKEVQGLIDHSYELVVKGLPRAEREKLVRA